ncbi:MAG: hemolysin III family protein [Krumholzibacteria bacterium]|nr:hemolysin III family protein [Candidatus Krumholzibacteria bacterium]
MRGAFAHDDFPRGEEIAHAITHGIGVLGSAAALVAMVVLAVARGSALLVVGVSVFGASMVILYTASTLYHALTAQRAKQVFKLLDHGAIYLLIAGTYTPFLLVVLGGPWGWSMFGVVWGLALLGIVYEVVLRRPWKWVSLASYLALGWLLVVVTKPLVAALPPGALLLLGAGGAAYTGGAVFYAWRGFPYHHAVWHLCVLGGTGCHAACVLRYVIPAA